MNKEKKIYGNLDLNDIPDDIWKNIENFANENGHIRETSRLNLVKMGKKVINYMNDLMASTETHIRWEALKTIEQIADPDSAIILFNAFFDDDHDIRWIAAEGIIRIGKPGLELIMRKLFHDPHSYLLRIAVHHVLYEMQDKLNLPEVKELMNVMDQGLISVMPFFVHRLLKKLE